ncbi:Protein CBG27512 [Caenorhabditis briggsae]|uniref:Protein CBG27512 n=1 Tax=Caenorhabditis briggsae TaxID=6238 RepID=B6IF27_CAEBR|nr:Protein CBG27512 [Caenorhabditis briggsae]CAR98507.1 Protein CBG27512 [Caenorhabditis briggsae]
MYFKTKKIVLAKIQEREKNHENDNETIREMLLSMGSVWLLYQSPPTQKSKKLSTEDRTSWHKISGGGSGNSIIRPQETNKTVSK